MTTILSLIFIYAEIKVQIIVLLFYKLNNTFLLKPSILRSPILTKWFCVVFSFFFFSFEIALNMESGITSIWWNAYWMHILNYLNLLRLSINSPLRKKGRFHPLPPACSALWSTTATSAACFYLIICARSVVLWALCWKDITHKPIRKLSSISVWLILHWNPEYITHTGV